MTHRQAHRLCTREKKQAMMRYERTKCQDTALAINAWDELQGQLHKPTPVKSGQFEKTKKTALRIVALIGDTEYRHAIAQRIKQLKL